MITLADLRKLDPTKIDLTRLDLRNVELPKLDLPKFELPKLDLPKFDLPKFDLPKFDLPRLDLPKLEAPVELPFDRVGALARDAAYVGVGAAVVAAKTAATRRRTVTDQVSTRVRRLVRAA